MKKIIKRIVVWAFDEVVETRLRDDVRHMEWVMAQGRLEAHSAKVLAAVHKQNEIFEQILIHLQGSRP